MTFESDLLTQIKTVTALGTRVFPDVAPVATTRPYCTYQQVGGQMVTLLDNSKPGVRLPDIQVTVWADTNKQAISLSRAIEDALRAATSFFAAPIGEPVADFDVDMKVYGARQDFRCRHTT